MNGRNSLWSLFSALICFVAGTAAQRLLLDADIVQERLSTRQQQL